MNGFFVVKFGVRVALIILSGLFVIIVVVATATLGGCLLQRHVRLGIWRLDSAVASANFGVRRTYKPATQ